MGSEDTAPEMESSDGSLIIEELLQSIKQRGLQMPVMLMLEMHRPLSGIGNSCFLLLRPFLGLVISSHKLEILQKLLEKPELVDMLISRLENDK